MVRKKSSSHVDKIPGMDQMSLLEAEAEEEAEGLENVFSTTIVVLLH